MFNLDELFGELSDLEIKLYLENDKLCFEAPEGALNEGLRNKIKNNKEAIIETLRKIEQSSEKIAFSKISKFEAREKYPLSFSQKRLWFLYRWDSESSNYNMPTLIEMDDTLSAELLHEAFLYVIKRHSILHTAYIEESAVPSQYFLDPNEFCLQSFDIDSLDASGSPQDKRELISSEFINRSFDLESELPIRACIIQGEGLVTSLLICQHHISGDGWSSGILLKELAVVYSALEKGSDIDLPELSIQYADYALWQNSAWDAGIYRSEEGYWKEQLSDCNEPLELPADYERPNVRTHVGQTFHFSFSESVSHQLELFCQKYDMTPYVVLLAVYKILLHKYSGKNIIAVGSPIAGRNEAEIEGLIGCFINTLVFKSDVNPEDNFISFLSQVKEETLSALANQNIPFDKIIEELNVDRNLKYSPLFQSMFVFDNTPKSDISFSSIKTNRISIARASAKFETTVVVFKQNDSYAGRITFNSDVFKESRVKNFVEHFKLLTKSLLAEPTQKTLDLQLTSSEELELLTNVWNDNESSYGEFQSVSKIFESTADEYSKQTAVIFEDTSISYEELNKKANQFARHLQSNGVTGTSVVAVFLDRSIEAVVTLLAIVKVGAAYVPIDPQYPIDRIQYMLETSSACLIVTDSQISESLEFSSDIPKINIDEIGNILTKLQSENLPSNTSSSDLMYVIFTSGSTGRPKGVQVTYGNYFNYINGLINKIDIKPGWTFAMLTTFAADLNTTTLYGSLISGGTLHLISYERATSPDDLIEYFLEHPIDLIKIVPSHFDAIQKPTNTNAIIPKRCLIFSGEPCSWDLVERVRELRPNCHIENHYGPTETTVSALTYRVPELLPEKPFGHVPIGKALPNVSLYVLDDNKSVVPVGVPGELYIGGAGVSNGYIGQPELTEERFISLEKINNSHSAVYRTGDLVRYSTEGNIEFLGRTDDQVKVRGYRVELSEIKNCINGLSGIKDSVVLTYINSAGLASIVAYFISDSDAIEIAQLRTHCKSQLPDYMIPAIFMPVESIPVTSNGKLNKTALPKPQYVRDQASQKIVLPESATECQIHAIWKEVLEIEEIGIDDDFFDLGGESFKAINVITQLENKIGIIDFFQSPTVRSLAKALDDAEGSDAERKLIHKFRQVGEEKYSLVCVPYGGGSAISYQPMAYSLPEDYALYAVEIPGHDFQRPDELLEPIPDVARKCVQEILEKTQGKVILYGHCLGASLALEIAHVLEESGVELAGVFLAGSLPLSRPPGKLFDLVAKVFPRDRWGSRLRYEELMVSLGAFASMDDTKQFDFIIRNMRHDARESEDYITSVFLDKSYEKLRSPILCIIGERDRATELFQERHRGWKKFGEKVELAIIPKAGHFFLKNMADKVTNVVDNQVRVWNEDQEVLPEEYQLESYPELAGGVKESVDKIEPSFGLFLRIMISQTFSLLGSQVLGFGLGVWLYLETGSVANFALVVFLNTLPGILMLPIGGAIADRHDRRKIMMISDCIVAMMTIAIAVAYHYEALVPWLIFLRAFLGSVTDAFQQPAYTAGRSQIVPKHYLAYANGLSQMGTATSRFTAPLLGGFLIMTVGLDVLIAIDLIAFLVAFLILLRNPFPNSMYRRIEEPFIKALSRGFQFIIQRKSMLAMVGFFVVSNFLLGMMMALTTPLVLSFSTAVALGLVASMRAMGEFSGGLIMGIWGGTKRRAEGMVGFVALNGLSVIIVSIYPLAIFPMIGVFGMGLANSITNAHWETLIQHKVGMELQGRIFSINRMMARSALPLGILVAGFLADYLKPLTDEGGIISSQVGWLFAHTEALSMSLIMLAVGTCLILWTIAGLRYKPLRYMEDILPDAIHFDGMEGDIDELQEKFDQEYDQQKAVKEIDAKDQDKKNYK